MKNFFLKLFYIFSHKDKYEILLIFFLMIFGAGLETFSIGIIPTFIGLLNNPELVQQQYALNWLYSKLAIESNQKFLLLVSVLLLGIYLFKNVYLAILTYYQFYFLYRKQVALSLRLLKVYLYSPYVFYLYHNSADLIRNITSEIPHIFEGIFTPTLILTTEAMVMTCIGLLLFILEPIPSLIALLFLGISILVVNNFSRNSIIRNGQIRQEQNARVFQWANQSIGGIKEIKILGKEFFFANSFKNSNQSFCKASLAIKLANNLPSLFIDTILVSTVLLFQIFMLAQHKDTLSILPVLSLFAIAALRLMPSAKRIVSSIANIRFYKYAIELIYHDLTSLENEVFMHSNVNTSFNINIDFNDKIELKNIYHRYPNSNDDSLFDISLSIPMGKSVAFVGPSGSGKTTIINIILGLLTPSKGRILVDGKSIIDNLSSWQSKIGYIPQDIYLSDDTICNNIAFGMMPENIDISQVWRVIKATQLQDFVNSLPRNIETFVGEGGVRLSGGQRQRIGIARALYHNPSIIVMDEATAALDNLTEREFMNSLESASGDKTLIMIAHRLSTVRNCDCLFFLKSGRLIAMGTYDELVANCSDFKEMI